jgi:hypothetical protein
VPGADEALALLSKAQLQDNQIDVLWRADFVDRQVRAALEGLFGSEPPKDFVRLVRKRIPSLGTADIRASLARALVTVDYPIPLPSAAAAQAPRRSQPSEPEANAIASAQTGAKTPWRHVTMLDLISHGLITPPFDIETRYKGQLLSAVIEGDGSVTWSGDRYESLSLAGGMARKSIVGSPPGRDYPPTNGWTFWRYRHEDGKLRPVDELRRELYERKVVDLSRRATRPA